MVLTRPGDMREVSPATSQDVYRAVRVAGLESEVRGYAGALGYQTGDRQDWHNGNGDAFRHATASALLTRDYGPLVAELAGAVHEAQDTARWAIQALYHAVGAELEYQTFSQHLAEVRMDSFNNGLGRDPSLSEDATDRFDVARRVSDKIAAGAGRVIKGDALVRSGSRQDGQNAGRASRDEADQRGSERIERDFSPFERIDRVEGTDRPSIMYDDINFDVRRAGSRVA